jgi:hypothetical protein
MMRAAIGIVAEQPRLLGMHVLLGADVFATFDAEARGVELAEVAPS